MSVWIIYIYVCVCNECCVKYGYVVRVTMYDARIANCNERKVVQVAGAV